MTHPALGLSWFGAVAAGLVGLATAWYVRRHEGDYRHWLRDAKKLGLALVRDPATDEPALVGERDGHAVRVERVAASFKGPVGDFLRVRLAGLPFVRITVPLRGEWPAGVSVRPREGAPVARTSELDARRMVGTGDAEFDEAFEVRGDEAAALALLDGSARRALAEWMDPSHGGPPLHVRSAMPGALVTELNVVGPDHVVVEPVLKRMLAVADRLDRRGRSLHRCLAENTRAARPWDRARHLAAMVAHAPGTPDTLLACRSWLDEEDAALRVEAACGAGRSGADALLAFLQDPSSEPGHVTRALAAWSALDPVPGDPEAILRPLLGDDGGSGIRRAAVRAAGRVRCAAVLSLVACSAETDAGDALEVVTALTRLAAAGTEPALVRLLASPFETVRLAALRALAATGTLASVPALLPLSSGVLGSAQVREAATDAVRAIRARLGPVESGRVSLAADAAAEGALSLGGDGALSLARAEPGALSRAPGDVPGPADMADDRARVQHPGDT